MESLRETRRSTHPPPCLHASRAHASRVTAAWIASLPGGSTELTAAGSSTGRIRPVSRSGWSTGRRWERMWSHGARGAERKVRSEIHFQAFHQRRGNEAASLSSLTGRGSYTDNVGAERQGSGEISLL